MNNPYTLAGTDSIPSGTSWIPEVASSAWTRIMGLSFLASLFQHAYLLDSVKLLVLGSIIETGRRLCQWLIERFRFRESLLLITYSGLGADGLCSN